MKIYVTNLYTDEEKVYEGSPEQIEEQLLAAHPWLGVKDSERDLITTMERLDANQGYMVETERSGVQEDPEAPEVALITAYDEQGQLLLGKRNDNGKWTLPGGHLDLGEAPEDGARRELVEETGLEPVSLSYLKKIRRRDGLILHCFSAYVQGEPHGNLDPDKECAKWEFVDVSGGIPSKIYDNLHGPAGDENLVRQVFDLKKAEEVLEKALHESDVNFVKPKDGDGGKTGVHKGIGYKWLMDAHPAVHNKSVEEFRANVLKSPKTHRPTAIITNQNYTNETGVMEKAIYKVGGKRYMIKPHWDKASPRAGFAEMANQALYHAAGIGHLHQTVHTDEMKVGGETYPMTVIHMEPGLDWLEKHKEETLPDSTRRDLSKIHMIDYLVGNNDRHSRNVMISPDLQRVLAIDHGYSLVYGLRFHHEWSAANRLGEGAHGASEFGVSALRLWKEKGPAIRKAFLEHAHNLKGDALERARKGFLERANNLDVEVRRHLRDPIVIK